jgi:hypothetical protein
MSKLVSPIEVTLTCLQIPIIQKSIVVKYIDSKPPHLRIKVLSKSSFLGFHPIDIYKFRPSKIEYLTFYEYFEKFELIKMVHPSFQQYGKDALSFIIYKNEKLVRFINFHRIHNNEGFFYNVLLQKISFVMKRIYFPIVTSINPMYMHVKLKIYYQILNLYTTFFTNMQHEIYLEMRNKHNYSIKC